MAITAEQYREAAKRAMAAGNVEVAEELAAAGIALQGSMGLMPDEQVQIQDPTLAAMRDGTYKPPEAPPLPQISRGRAAAIMAGQGASLNTTDEISARLQSISPNITYEDALAENQRLIDAANQQYPRTSLAANIGGAVVQGAAMAAPGIVRAGIARAMPATMAGKVVASAGLGATVGAGQGAIAGACCIAR
jgi:hypothetical protein